MRWIIDGADRDSGEDRTVLVQAETRNNAEQEAARLGLLIGAVRAEDPRRLPRLEELASDPTDENIALSRLAEEWTLPAIPPRPRDMPQFPGLLYAGRILRVLAIIAYALGAILIAMIALRLAPRALPSDASRQPLQIFLAFLPALTTLGCGALLHVLGKVALTLRTMAQRTGSPPASAPDLSAIR